MNDVIIDSISKSYGKKRALAGVSAEIKPGEIFGFIGADGAGKTTLFRVLTTLLLPDSGSASVCGLDARRDWKRIRPLLGYMPGRFSLYEDLSVEENLNFFAAAFSTTVKENYDSIREIYDQLAPFRTRRAGKLSGGMKQKLALCCALVHKPEVLFLDEPTTGVDAVSRKEFWELLARIRERGVTIVASTPYMDEASRCDRVALISDGRLLATDSPARLTKSFGLRIFEIIPGNKFEALLTIEKLPNTSRIYPFGQSLHYVDRRADITAEDVKRIANGVIVREIEPDIEDVFIMLMDRHDKVQ
ncbi:MAG: ABC transporter ATP-binding protein [Chloroflexota bacterium]